MDTLSKANQGHWYSNRGGKFHKASDAWIHTGLALCGRNIAHPSLTRPNTQAADERCCKTCKDKS